MSTRGRRGGSATAAAGANWRDRGSADRSSADAAASTLSSSGGYRGRGRGRGRGRESHAVRGDRNAPAPAERSQPPTRKQHEERNDSTDAKPTLPRSTASALGTCAQMCPRAEVLERTRTMEISRFERPPPGSNEGDVFSFAVKKYRRAAAGQIEIDRAELRPPHVLLHTLQHLFANVLPWTGCGFDWLQAPSPGSSSSSSRATEREQVDFLALYHFISDRVRSVRKDFMIQRVEDASAVEALEKIVRFHILASLRARQLLHATHHQQGDWSENLNDQQLASALSQLQVLYQKCSVVENGSEDTTKVTMPSSSDNQSEFVAYDILLHADDPRAVSFMLVKVSESTRRSPLVKRALTLFVALQIQDFHTFFRDFQLASPLEKSLLLKHLPVMWTAGVQMMNKAFGKQDQFKLEEFAKWLRLPGGEAAQRLCKATNLHTEAAIPPVVAPVPSSSSTPATSDSWEDDDGRSPLPPPAPLRESREPPAAAGFIRFKVSPLSGEIDKDTMETLLADVAQRIHLEEVHGLHSASDLILKETYKQEAAKWMI